MLEGSVSPLPRSLAVPLGGVRRLSTTTALAGVVLGSFLIRWLLALGRPTPTLFPDEYIYAALARALSGGDLSVRGTPAHFPALLEPLLAAPLWLTGDAEIAYRLTQGLHSLAMSLAAVPVYLLARRVGIRPGYALAAGALAVLSPDLLYSSFLLADPIGYPVALTAVYLGVRALAQPTGRLQLAFLAACGLATFARVQYVVLPAAFVLSALVVERGSVRRALGRYRTTFGLLLAGAVSIGAVGLNRVLGYYEDVLALDLNAQLLGRWLALDLLFLALAAGVVLVPGAAAGLAAGIARPRTREEAAFASFVAATAGILLFQAALFAANGAEKFQERYLMILLPLAAISFLLFVGRRPSRPARLGVVAVGAALVLGASTTPIAAQPVDASPFLLGGAWLTLRIGEANASLIVAAGAALLAGLGVLAALRVRGWAAAGVAVAAVTSATISLAAAGFDGSNSRAVLSTTMAADPSWVDHAGSGPVALVQLPNGRRHREIGQLFWNESVDRVLSVAPVEEVDAFGSRPLTIDDRGILTSGGRRIERELLIHTYGSQLRLEDASLVGRAPSFELWRPGPSGARVAWLAAGFYEDGWLAGSAKVTVWPTATDEARVLTFVVSRPGDLPATRVRLSWPGGSRAVELGPGARQTVSVEVPRGIRRAWTLSIEAETVALLGDWRPVVARVSGPRLEVASREASRLAV